MSRFAPRGGKESAMTSILYAEVYLLCIGIVSLCIYWSTRRSSNSAPERWLYVMLVGFMVSFVSNLLFTLFNSILVVPGMVSRIRWR